MFCPALCIHESTIFIHPSTNPEALAVVSRGVFVAHCGFVAVQRRLVPSLPSRRRARTTTRNFQERAFCFRACSYLAAAERCRHFREFFFSFGGGTSSELSVSLFVFRELSLIMAGSMAALARRSRRFMSSSSSSSAAAVASSGSWWKDVQPAARDPILGVTEAFLADTHPSKMNVGVVRFPFLIPCVFVSFFLFDLS